MSGHVDWRLARRVTAQLAADNALTLAALAERLRVSESDLKPVIGMLIGRKLLERCDGYLVLAIADKATR